MDCHYEQTACFSGDQNSFHRHTRSNNINHMSMDFSSVIIPPQIPMSQSATDVTRLSHVGSTTYESHDDLCVEQCVGVGLYNGSQIFNHRGAPPAIPSRWSSRVTSAAHHNPGSLYDFSLGLDPNSMHYRPGLAHSPSSTYQPWFGHQPQPDLDQSLPGGDEDSCSILSCCDSQCTMTDKCSNVTCANKEDTCTDQNCPERPAAALPSEIVDGATALISINNAPEQQQDAFPMQSFHHQESILNNFNFDLSNTSHNFPFSPLVNRVASHLLVAHGEDASSACTRPCLLDDPRNYPNCPMPTISNISSFNGQYNAASLRLQLGTDDLTACRAEVHDPETYLEHFNQQHRQFFASSNHNPLGNIQHTLPETSAMSPIGAMSSSGETPVDIHDSTEFSGTPSPLTPMSNSLDMADLKQEEIVSPLGRERSMSEVSSDGLSIHRCFWREEGLRGVCDELFSTPEELFNHASTVHIKNAKKGDQGFRCGWDDCPRSKAGASGFPQRSKIERHMQTHIDHKPHICTVCHKGFSAKQALNQHMFIHTNQKPLVCEICNKAFRYPSALTMHQRVHSGEKPLECHICHKRFSESSNLSKHKRTHELRGRFACRVPGCDRNFHRQDQLRRHMKTHQKDGDGGPVEMLTAKLETAFEQA